MSDDLLTTIERLLDSARPEGEPHRRLIKWRDQLHRNVFLGPGPRKYIEQLEADLANVTIECQHLTPLGKCLRGGRCKHLDDNKTCPYYEEARPLKRGENPLGSLVE